MSRFRCILRNLLRSKYTRIGKKTQHDPFGFLTGLFAVPRISSLYTQFAMDNKLVKAIGVKRPLFIMLVLYLPHAQKTSYFSAIWLYYR